MSDSNGPKLLIVDDDEMVGRTIELIARRHGWQVRVTCEADRFLALVEEWRPDTVAIDLVMPGMDGVQVLNELASRHCRACVVVISGVGHRVLDAAGRSAREHGLHFGGVLPKPFSNDDVRGLLDRCTADQAVSERVDSANLKDDPGIDMAMLERALEDRQFFMVYQPKVHCSDGSLAGLEALVRWRHPSRGIIPPGSFIPLFETSNLMGALTRQIIDMSLEWFAGLRAPAEGEMPITLSLNISARSLEDAELVEGIARQCRKHGVEHNRLIFELTETSAMQDPVRSLELLTRLRVMGFQLSLDDFGTGYSSMLQLVRLPFSEIKVDQSFVMSAEQSEESRNVVRSVIELGRSLGLKTTAEGIESEAVMEFLRSIGCDYGQGYFISKPLAGDEIRQQWGL